MLGMHPIVLAIIVTSIISFFFISIILHYWSNNYYKSAKFQTFGPYINGMAATLICFGIIFQVVQWEQSEILHRVDGISQLTVEFLQPIIEIFIDHPEMNYYYNDLLGIKHINKHTKRNILLENQISMLIFAKLIVPAMYVDPIYDLDHTGHTRAALKKTMDTFIKSTVFVSYWTNIFKPKFAGEVTLNYMKENYGL